MAGVVGGGHKRARFGDGPLVSRAPANCGGLEDADGISIAAELGSFQQPKVELYQRLVEALRNLLVELTLGYEIVGLKVDSIRSRLFGALRAFYQKQDQSRLLVQFPKASIDRLLAEGKE